jgi:hypothetical protein
MRMQRTCKSLGKILAKDMKVTTIQTNDIAIFKKVVSK